jgi:uncharacterized protein
MSILIVEAAEEESTGSPPGATDLEAGHDHWVDADETCLDGGHAGRRRVLPARILLALVRAYQLSRTGRVSPCRFTPTCSTYAIEAVERHGALRGAALTARRLGRCRPGGPSGYDPVPE